MIRIAGIALIVACSNPPEPRRCATQVVSSMEVAELCERECEAGDGASCGRAAMFWGSAHVDAEDAPGEGAPDAPLRPPRDRARGERLWRRGCALGDRRSCDAIPEPRPSERYPGSYPR